MSKSQSRARDNADDEVGIQAWVRDAYECGAREADKADQAQLFIEEALALDDPASALFEPVAAYIGTLLHRLSVAQEREAGPWRDPASEPGKQDSKPSTGRRKYKKTQTTVRQLRQLDEHKYVPGYGMVPWREITVKHIDAAIAHYRASINGIQASIAVWESARALLTKHRVKTLGDVPGFRPEDMDE